VQQIVPSRQLAIVVDDPWVTRLPADVRVPIYCFPYAGGGASAFHGWADLLPDGFGVSAARPAGRESRSAEVPLTDVHQYADGATDAIIRRLGTISAPAVLLGHSLGALVAFEVARRLIGHGIGVRALAVLAHQSPSTPWEPVDDPPDLLRRRLAARLGMSPDAPDLDEVADLLLPPLVADMAMRQNYRYRGGPPLTCPIHVFTGVDDDTGADRLRGWASHTSAGCTFDAMPGDHFFPWQDPASFLRRLVERLGSATR
jgi:medium-chain acyl-[acyl-carrier-protein] hydrolase